MPFVCGAQPSMQPPCRSPWHASKEVVRESLGSCLLADAIWFSYLNSCPLLLVTLVPDFADGAALRGRMRKSNCEQSTGMNALGVVAQALLHRAVKGKPMSVLKYAMTLDGKIATTQVCNVSTHENESKPQMTLAVLGCGFPLQAPSWIGHHFGFKPRPA
jgi:hypothetical protein